MSPVAFGSAVGALALIFFGLHGLFYLLDSIPTAEAVSNFIHGGPGARWLLWYVKIFLGYGGLIGSGYYIVSTFYCWFTKVVGELWQESLRPKELRQGCLEEVGNGGEVEHDPQNTRMELHTIHDDDIEVLEMTMRKLESFIPLIDGGSYRPGEWIDARERE